MSDRLVLPQERSNCRITRADNQPTRIEGYAAVFFRADDPGTEFWLWDDYVERVMPGAFDETIGKDDCAGLFNHNDSIVLGRQSNKSLELTVDEVGLRYSILPPETTAAKDVVALIDRKDIKGSSFAFAPIRTTYAEEYRDGKRIGIRQIEKVQLYDVGPVTFPAYEATTTETRSKRRQAAFDRLSNSAHMRSGKLRSLELERLESE